MKNIVLVCNMGMSTSALMKKMRTYAESINYECTVEAYPVTELPNVVDEASVILVGPQISYMMDKIKGIAKEVPLAPIPAQLYGLLDGKGVIELAQKMIGE
jgi:PTS system cellobiose-specific IIB component